MKNLQDISIDNVFFLEKSCRKMNTIFSAVQRQQRKSDVMMFFDLTACSAIYYHTGSSLAEASNKMVSNLAAIKQCNEKQSFKCRML
jgi:hypothetical protein